MAGVFNAEEVLEIASRIEQNGARFYREAARLIKDKSLQIMLEKLARMEDDHEVTFDNMRGNPALLSEVLGDPDGMIVGYLGAIAGGHVFPVEADPNALFTQKFSIEDVLHKAISLEKDSIVFYQGIKELVPRENGKNKIDAIIREEMQHVVILSEALTSLAG